MLNHDTSNPMRILTAVKLMVVGLLSNLGLLMLMNQRGAAGDGGDGGKGGDGDGGGSGEKLGDWRDTLPAEIKSHPIFSKYKDSNEAHKALIEMQPLIGADKIIIPSKDATEKEWNERVFDRLGRPKEAKDYVLPTDLQIPKELPIDSKLVDGFKAEAHRIGLMPYQMAALYKWFMTEQISGFNLATEGSKKAMMDSETALRRDWGAAYEQNVTLARKVLGAFGDEGVVDLLSEGLGNDPRLLRFLANVGKNFSEDQLVGKGKSFVYAPAEALEEINKIKNDPNNPYHKADHPEHQAMVDKVSMLMKMAYPEK